MSNSAPTRTPADPESPAEALCSACHQDIHRPCQKYQWIKCPCADRTVECHVCRGSCLHLSLRPDGTYADCNACVGTGVMTLCTKCDGHREILVHRPSHRPVWISCDHCAGQGQFRCQQCLMSGKVLIFDVFCVGEFDSEPPRRHPNAKEFPRSQWSRSERGSPPP